MEARIRRHLKKRKKKRWHIDYLLTRRDAGVENVETYRQSECTVNRKTGGEVIAPGFGASDCRRGCRSHLRYMGPA